MAYELSSLNDDDLDVEELERRLELSVVTVGAAGGGSDCIADCACYCPRLNSCNTFCT